MHCSACGTEYTVHAGEKGPGCPGKPHKQCSEGHFNNKHNFRCNTKLEEGVYCNKPLLPLGGKSHATS